MRKASPGFSPFGYTALLAASVLYGTYGIWSRLIGPTFAPFYQAWVRSLLILLLMAPVLLAMRAFRKIDRQDLPQVGFYIAFCLFTQIPLYYAFNHAPIGTVQLIFYSMFVITAYAVGKFYLGEKITRIKLASMILAFAGLALVFGVSVIAFAPLALFFAALNGVASGGENASTKSLSDKYAPGLIVFWGWAAIFVTHLPISLLIGEPQLAPHFNTVWLYLLGFAVANAAAYWLAVEGFRRVDASIASLVGLAEIIFAVIFSAVIFHEAITWLVVAGGLVIMLAAALPDLHNLIRHKKIDDPVEPAREV